MALTKILNDENKSFQPVLTDKLVYDTKPTVNSFNGITSDAVARAIAGASGEVPAVTESDNGKVLTAVYDEGGAAVEWADAASGVPAAASADEGKVLGVTDNQGSIGWVAQTPAQVNSDWNAASGAAQILNKPSLATVATSGSYADLSNKPSIPAAQVQSDWDQTDNTAVDFIKNKPNIPAGVVVDQTYSASSTNAQSGTAVAGAIATVKQVPAAASADNGKVLGVTDTSGTVGWVAQTAAQVNADWNSSSGKSEILNKPNLATVATSGSYADLSNKPTIPTVDQSYSASSTNAQSGTAVAGALATVNQVPSSTSADEDKVLTVNSSGTPVWAAAQSGSSYTAGGGIDISAQDAISVKAGNGLTIGNYSYEHTGTINLTATPVLSQGSYSAPYIAQLTSDMLSQMSSTNGLQFTLNGAYDGSGQQLYIALATNATTYSTNLSNRLVFDVNPGTSIAAGTTFTVKTSEKVGSISTKSYADVAADVSSYYLIVLWGNESWGMWGNVGTTATSADPITTGTYTGTETVTVQNAVNLSVPIEVVAAMPANPTSGVLYIVTGA